ncbi:MAG: MBL fold metallo-hydrolase [Rhodothermales bacterium]
MPTLYLLGTGAAISDPHRTTTMLACRSGSDTLVIDCGGDVVQRLLASKIDLETISALIVTHEHPDHVSGFPLFMEKIWLAGRDRPIPVYGIRPAIEQARRALAAFDTSSWDLPEIAWNEVPHEPSASVMRTASWHVDASPGRHGVPVVGLRITARASGKTVAYSCDTEPCSTITSLATGADILVHEANGEGSGHSSASQAATTALDAGAKRLLLVHLPPGLPETDLDAARSIFDATEMGTELGSYNF